MNSTTHGVAPYPLYWPLHHARTAPHARREARFQVDFTTARNGLCVELVRLGARDIVISSNIPMRRDGLPMVPDREPDDPGIAVYFTRKTRPFVIACDHFRRVRWNIRAIGATLEALRSIERHGTTTMLEQAFSGFAALPPAGPKPWRDVLGVTGAIVVGPPGLDWVRTRYRELAAEAHPDRAGGSHDRMAEINAAYEAAKLELGGSS
jgi:hypothetical protein